MVTQGQSVEVNEETEVARLRAGGRPQPGTTPDISVDLEQSVGENTAPDRSGIAEGGYNLRTGYDGAADVLTVTIELDHEHREDFFSHDDSKVHNKELGKDVRVVHRAFGSSPWTNVAGLGGARHLSTYRTGSSFRDYRTSAGGYEADNHFGYRQPVLDRAFWNNLGNTDSLAPSNTEHIRWPTHFEHLHWYLYAIPDSEIRMENDWLRWVDDQGGEDFAASGYHKGTTALPATFTPCTLDKENVEARDIIRCDNRVQDGRYFPFDAPRQTGGTTPVAGNLQLLGPDMLIAAGVREPDDWPSGGQRKLNTFTFKISEADMFARGDTNVDATGHADLAWYGVPGDTLAKDSYLENWPLRSRYYGEWGGSHCAQLPTRVPTPTPTVPVSSPVPCLEPTRTPTEPQIGKLNPNVPHLMVLTFYERNNPYETNPNNFVEFKFTAAGGGEIGNFEIPERYMRRVVCRAVILPLGFDPAKAAADSQLQKVGERDGGGAGGNLRVLQ